MVHIGNWKELDLSTLLEVGINDEVSALQRARNLSSWSPTFQESRNRVHGPPKTIEQTPIGLWTTSAVEKTPMLCLSTSACWEHSQRMMVLLKMLDALSSSTGAIPRQTYSSRLTS
jgi:hypothetical protein